MVVLNICQYAVLSPETSDDLNTSIGRFLHLQPVDPLVFAVLAYGGYGDSTHRTTLPIPSSHICPST